MLLTIKGFVKRAIKRSIRLGRAPTDDDSPPPPTGSDWIDGEAWIDSEPWID